MAKQLLIIRASLDGDVALAYTDPFGRAEPQRHVERLLKAVDMAEQWTRLLPQPLNREIQSVVTSISVHLSALSEGLRRAAMFDSGKGAHHASEVLRRMSLKFGDRLEALAEQLTAGVTAERKPPLDTPKRSRLSPTESRIWEALPRRFLTDKQLASELFDQQYDPGNVRTHIAKIKKKGWGIDHVHGEGYYRPDAPPPQLGILEHGAETTGNNQPPAGNTG